MLIPVRCYTCNKIIGNKYEQYVKLMNDKEVKNGDNSDVFRKLKLRKYCCRRMILGYVPSLFKKLKN